MPVLAKAHRIKKEIEVMASTAASAHELMNGIVTCLNEGVLKFNWVGFYMLEEEKNGQQPMLVLGAFVGAMTPHTRIALHQGICGAAASSGNTVVVDDVQSDPRYLACSLETKSEIVVPVFAHGKVVGELDIDSHFPAAFTAEHQEFVQHCATLVGKKLEAARA